MQHSMASSLQDEAIKSLGFRMGVPPNFFILPSVHLRVITGTRGNIRKSRHLIPRDRSDWQI